MSSAAGIDSIFGGGLSAAGQLVAGQAQAGALNYNAAVNRMNADIALQQADADILGLKRDAAKTIGAMRAGFAASGISGDSGSALDLLAESTSQAVLDQQRRKYSGTVQATGLRNQAAIDKYSAKGVLLSSQLGAAGTLIGSGAKAVAG